MMELQKPLLHNGDNVDLTMREYKIIEKTTRNFINTEYRKILNQSAAIEDCIAEAQLHCFKYKRRYGKFKNGKNTIALITKRRIVNFINRDLRWFKNTGQRRNKNYYNTVIPHKIGFLKSVSKHLDSRTLPDFKNQLNRKLLEGEQIDYINKLCRVFTKKQLVKEKNKYRADFWSLRDAIY